jgi:tetratricopeptide (TPR) repeat protein
LDGSVKNVKVLKGVDPYLDKEAVRVVSNMPDWNPGEQAGNKVPVSYNLPIAFKLGISHLLELENNDVEYQKGIKFFGFGHYTKAIKMFTISLRKRPENMDSYYNRGICYFKQGKREEACKDWNKAKELGDKNIEKLILEHCK